MWTKIASVLIAVIGLAAVVVLVTVPVAALVDARQDMEALDAAVTAGSVRRLAPAGDVGGGAGQLFTVRRIAEFLTEPVRDRRSVSAVEGIGEGYPDPACLALRINGQLVSHAGTVEALIPASVQKLLTALAVVQTIGVDERFVTEVFATNVVDGGVLNGDLVLVGGGDPMLAQQVYADAYRRQPQLLTSIAELAATIADTGLIRVRGRIIVNDDRYDDVRVVETWPDRYRSQFNAGPIGALTVNDGFAEWEPARVYSEDPALYAGQVLGAELLRLGVRVDGQTRRGSPPDAALLASIESAPVGVIVQQMLRESDNNTAESLLKELGYRATGVGTTAGGAAVVVEAAAASGMDTAGLEVMDGSGLDRGNRVSCAQLAHLLEIQGPDSTIGGGLAVAGQTGTIGHRFIDTDVEGRLRAKTGLLNNVNGFAGWIEGPDGTVVTFAQLLNGVPLNSREGLELQELLAAELASISIDLTVEDIVALGLELPPRGS